MNDKFQTHFVKGWHQPEIWAGGVIRWTKKEAVFVIKISGKKIKFEIGTLKPDIEKGPIVGNVFCNGMKIGHFILNEHGWKEEGFEIHEKLKGEVARFKITLNYAWRPDDFSKNGDKRELGICVRRIWCEE
jgi:hypothetical protein